MPRFAVAVRGAGVDLCRVPAEIGARFGVTLTPLRIPDCQFRSGCRNEKGVTTC